MTTLRTDELATTTTTVTFNGEPVSVPAGTTSIVDFIRAENRRRGIVTFVAVANGHEVASAEELDQAFEDGDSIEIRTHAKPGF